jgi:hypothetical protein
MPVAEVHQMVAVTSQRELCTKRLDGSDMLITCDHPALGEWSGDVTIGPESDESLEFGLWDVWVVPKPQVGRVWMEVRSGNVTSHVQVKSNKPTVDASASSGLSASLMGIFFLFSLAVGVSVQIQWLWSALTQASL